MQTPVKVLYVNGNIMKRGGIEAFMMNYFRHINRSRVHIDFLVHGNEKGVYDDEITAAGSTIYHVPTKSKHPIKYQKDLKKLFQSVHFDIVHSHLDAMSGWILKIAKECGVQVRIAHSHNTDHLTTNFFKRVVNDYWKNQILKYATHFFACSQEAGEWLFGNYTNFEIINNAIEIEKFYFSSEKRESIRKAQNWEEKKVIGHVGRFDYQKNQEFLIPILKEVIKKNRNTVLVFVGCGESMQNVEQLAIENGVQNNVIFLGSIDKVYEFYNAFDIFVLPSRFEGLGIVAIEAQANGLPCVLSDEIPRIVKINDNVVFLPLNQRERWIDEICKNVIRIDSSVKAQLSRYDINVEAKKLEEIYLRILKNE